MAGCGSNSTTETLDLVDHAKKSKADAALLVTPYYNKPSEDGLFKHYKFISEKINLPIYLYDIPGRSIVRLSINLIKKLSKIKNIIGIKDATSDLSSPMEVRRTCGKNFIQLSGEDATFLAFLMNGGTGCISVTANVVPKISSQIYESWKNKDFIKSMELNHLLYPLNNALFLQSSPCPVKYALSKMNKCSNILRLPLTPVNEDTMNGRDLVLKHLNLRGGVALDNAYAVDKKGEFWVMNLYIDLKEYERSYEDLDNLRPKKLLLKKDQISKINFKIKQNGFTMIPLDLHFNKNGFVKVLLGISKGRKKSDLREYKKQQDWKRDKARLEKH